MMSEEKIVGVAEVGTSKVLSEKQTIEFRFHDFENLPHKRGEFVQSPSIPCHGHRWELLMFPGGHNTSDENEVNVTVYLRRLGATRDIEAQFVFRVDSAGVKGPSSTRRKFHVNDCAGYSNFAKRADVLDPTKKYLVDGTLTIKADIQLYLDQPERWTPRDRLKQDMLQLFKSGKFADVTFVIGDAKFPAHRSILVSRAPLLLELTEDIDHGTDIPIPNVDSTIFEALLHFIYSEELPPGVDLAQQAKALLEVADKYHCSSLKLVAEAELATSGITVENASDLLLFADSKNCALLKETTVKFFLDNRDAVMKTKGYSNLLAKSSKLLDELMRELTTPVVTVADETNIDRMRVTILRRKLDERGLDVDGTREMLVKRLKTSSVDADEESEQE